MHRLFIFLFLSFFISSSSNGQIVVNELASTNDFFLPDFNGDFPDWIELYNTGDTDFDLSGYHLSDDSTDLSKWTFPSNSIVAAQSHMLLFASGKDTLVLSFAENDEISSIERHINFKLSAAQPELISLSDSMGNLLFQETYPLIPKNHSYGRRVDGSDEWVYFESVSPQMSNTALPVDIGLDTDLGFSQESGFYDAPFSLSFDSAEDTILYTFDANLPNQASLVYDGPLNIDKTSVVCARTLSNGFLNANQCKTYFVELNTDLPVLSIIASPASLFSEDIGIYVKGLNAEPDFPYWGANYWRDSKIPIFAEYFETDALETTPLFQKQIRLKIHGGRSSRNQEMRSLRLLFDPDDAVFERPLFEQKKEILSFPRLILRNSGSDFNLLHYRDAIIHQTLASNNANIDLLSYQPVQVYLNGNYWGLHNLREKIDAYYIQSNYGISPSNIDLLEEDTIVIEGGFTHFHEMLDFFNTQDLSNSDNFAVAENYLDVDSFKDYIATQIILGNIDWPNNNIKYWREKPDGKWRYLLFDLDVSLNGNRFAPADMDFLDIVLGPINEQTPHIQLFKSLLENEGFKHNWVNRSADLMNSFLGPEAFMKTVYQQQAYLFDEMLLHFQRWPSGNLETWEEEINSVRLYLEERIPTVRQNYLEHLSIGEMFDLNLQVFPLNTGSIKLNSIDVRQFPWEGVYFDEVPIQLTAVPLEGFQFDHWLIDGQTQIYENELSGTWNNMVTIEAIFTKNEGQTFPTLLVNNLNYNGNHSLNLDFYVETSHNYTLSVFNVQGKDFFVGDQQAFVPGLYQLQLPVGHLSSGQYFLRLMDGNALVQVFPFVVVE